MDMLPSKYIRVSYFWPKNAKKPFCVWRVSKKLKKIEKKNNSQYHTWFVPTFGVPQIHLEGSRDEILRGGGKVGLNPCLCVTLAAAHLTWVNTHTPHSSVNTYTAPPPAQPPLLGQGAGHCITHPCLPLSLVWPEIVNVAATALPCLCLTGDRDKAVAAGISSLHHLWPGHAWCNERRKYLALDFRPTKIFQYYPTQCHRNIR